MSSGFTSLRSNLPNVNGARVRDPRTGARLTNNSASNPQTSGDGQPANAPARRSPLPPERMPKWFRTGDGFRLPQGHRCKCISCHGAGSHVYEGLLAECPFCMRGEAACMTHRCRTCDGSGMVCPRCRGMRFFRVALPVGNEAIRCDTCCEGNQVNAAKERREIIRYLNRHPHADDLPRTAEER